jgi:hypothetical protein
MGIVADGHVADAVGDEAGLPHGVDLRGEITHSFWFGGKLSD